MVHPLLLSEIMPKHDKDAGDIGEKYRGQLGLVHIAYTQQMIKTHIHEQNIPFVSVHAD